MRFVKFPVLIPVPLTRCLGGWRQSVAAFTCLLLAGVAGAQAAEGAKRPVGHLAEAAGIGGGVAADEPAAARAAAGILAAGGNAADAAVAAALALAVALPSRAGLGGGGVCLVHNPVTGRDEALDFLAPAAAEAGTPAAVPAMVPGLFALWARSGTLDWPALVAPAEALARDGLMVSRALASDLARIGGPAPIGAPDVPLAQDDRLVQAELAATLAEVGRLDAAAVYGGRFARRLAEALSVDRIAAYQPRWRLPISVHGDQVDAIFAPPPATGGVLEAQMWAMAGGRYAGAPAVQRPHLFVEVARRAFAQRRLWLMPDGSLLTPVRTLLGSKRTESLMASYVPHRRSQAAIGLISGTTPPDAEAGAATGFVTLDRNGGAVACNLTVHTLFGLRRTAPGMGFLLVPAPSPDRREWVRLGPMLAVTAGEGRLRWAAAAAGGRNAPTALVAVALNTLVAGRPLGEAISVNRFHHQDQPDFVEAEAGVSEPLLVTLRRRGHRVHSVALPGRVNAAYCAEGLPGDPEGCAVATDPRGHGAALTAE